MPRIQVESKKLGSFYGAYRLRDVGCRIQSWVHIAR
jgi:hypothetical protein